MSGAPAILSYQGLTPEQDALAQAAASIFSDHADVESAGAELGFFGIGVPEHLGGSGGSLDDLAVVVEAAGWAAAASAVAWTTGVVAQLLVASSEPPAALLGQVAAGLVRFAVPVADPGRLSRTLVNGPTVTGSVRALGGDVGAIALPSLDAGSGVCSIVVLDAGHPRVTRSVLAPLDATRPLVEWHIDAVPLADTTRVVVDGAVDRWRALVALMCGLDAAGAARAALDRTISYAKHREQFGRPIGSFQAYKHRCATAMVELKLAQAIAFRGARELAADGETLAALAAGIAATDSAVSVCGDAVQLHGAIGVTWECDVHRWLKRAATAQLIANNPATTHQLLRTLLDARND